MPFSMCFQSFFALNFLMPAVYLLQASRLLTSLRIFCGGFELNFVTLKLFALNLFTFHEAYQIHYKTQKVNKHFKHFVAGEGFKRGPGERVRRKQVRAWREGLGNREGLAKGNSRGSGERVWRKQVRVNSGEFERVWRKQVRALRILHVH